MGKFETLVLPELENIRRKIARGMSPGELAQHLGISLTTLKRYRKQYPAFGELFSEADSANDDLVVLNNRGTQIVLGMSQGPITEEGYDREIHELYIYKRLK